MADLNDMKFDDFMNNTSNSKSSDKIKTTQDLLEQKFEQERLDWTNSITNMSKKMKNIALVSELQTEIYTERQKAVEYYHYLLSILSRVNKKYRMQWSEKYEFYSYKSQKRFPNEKTKETQILHEISEILMKREAIENHYKFINNTINTIDNLIYGIKYKVEIEQINRGK